VDLLAHCGAFCATTAILRRVAAHAQQRAKLVFPEDRYDLRRLHYPLAAELASEKRGGVHICDSVELNGPNATLDEKFERTKNIMFRRVNHLAVTVSEPAEVEDDGCG
jgi:hypothetical protein